MAEEHKLQFPLIGHFLTTCNCGSWAKTHSISMILNAVGTVCKTTTCTYPSFFTEVSLSGGRRYPLYSFLIVLGLKIENLMCYCGWGLPWICDFECFMVYFYIKLWESIQVKVKAFTCQATASFQFGCNGPLLFFDWQCKEHNSLHCSLHQNCL